MVDVRLRPVNRHRPLRFTRPVLRGIGVGLTGLFNLYDTRPSNALTGNAISLLGMSGNPVYPTRTGLSLRGNIFGGADVFTTATLETTTTVAGLIPGTDATFVWVGSVFNLTYGGVMCRGDDSSGNGSSLRMVVTSGGEAQFSYVDTSPAAFTATTSGAGIAVDEVVVIVGVKRGTSVQVYCKNKTASASGGNGNLRTSGRGVSLNYAGNSTTSANGGAANHMMAATFSRAVTSLEALSLLENPWQLFTPTTVFNLSAATASGSATVTANQVTSASAVATISMDSTTASNQVTSTSSTVTVSMDSTTTSNQVTSTSSTATISMDSTTTSNQVTSTSSSATVSTDGVSSAGQVTSTSSTSTVSMDATSTSNQVTSTLASSGGALDASATSGQVTSANATVSISMDATSSANQVTSTDSAVAAGSGATVTTGQVTSANAVVTISTAATVAVNQATSANSSVSISVDVQVSGNQVTSVSALSLAPLVVNVTVNQVTSVVATARVGAEAPSPWQRLVVKQKQQALARPAEEQLIITT